jgi:hypothetical protein
MAGSVLAAKGARGSVLSHVGPSPNEWIVLIEARRSDVVCISALPPYAFAPARAMCKQIRERFPKLKVWLVVCVCGISGDTHKAKARFERTQFDRLSTALRSPWSMFSNSLVPSRRRLTWRRDQATTNSPRQKDEEMSSPLAWQSACGGQRRDALMMVICPMESDSRPGSTSTFAGTYCPF